MQSGRKRTIAEIRETEKGKRRNRGHLEECEKNVTLSIRKNLDGPIQTHIDMWT